MLLWFCSQTAVAPPCWTDASVSSCREREKAQRQTDTKHLQPTPPCRPNQEQPDTEKIKREQKITTMIHIRDLKVGTCAAPSCGLLQCHENIHSTCFACPSQCVQRHLSAWYSVVLDQKLRMDKATALCDWKRMLGVWRAWRAAVWEEKKRQEVARTEQELQRANRRVKPSFTDPHLETFHMSCSTRAANICSDLCRQNQLAAEHQRQRLLRRCLTEWRWWCRMEKKQRENSEQQQEIQHKVAALLDAVSTVEVNAAERPNDETGDAPAELPQQPESSEKVREPQSRC